MAESHDGADARPGETWIHRIEESRDKWDAQRAALEAQMAALEARLPDPVTPENRAFRTLVGAQIQAVRTLFDARSTAAHELLIVRDAAEGFSRVPGSHATDTVHVRLQEVAWALLEAQEKAAQTLLTAQTLAAQVLRSEQIHEAKTLTEQLGAPATDEGPHD